MTARTPGPWRILYGHDTHKIKRDHSGRIVGPVTLDFEDYQHAVECVNANDTLTAENAALRAALGYALDYLLSEKSDCEDGRIDIAREPLEYAINKARAALAQGKGRE